MPFRRLSACPLLAVALLGVAASPMSAQDKKESPSKPANRQDKAWEERHKSCLERAGKGGIDVLFLGDSITSGWEISGKDAWKKHFEPLKAAQFGMSGDKTQHLLWRVTDFKEQSLTPKVVVILIGTNNIGANRSGELTAGGNTPEEISDGIAAVVQAVRRQMPDSNILLLGLLPRGTDPKMPVRGRIGDVNKVVAKAVNDKRVRYLDVGDKLLDKGTLPDDISPDGLHLSPKGYKVLAEALLPTIEELLKKRAVN